LNLFVVKLFVSFDILIAGRVLCDKGALTDKRAIMVKVFSTTEIIYIS